MSQALNHIARPPGQGGISSIQLRVKKLGAAQRGIRPSGAIVLPRREESQRLSRGLLHSPLSLALRLVGASLQVELDLESPSDPRLSIRPEPESKSGELSNRRNGDGTRMLGGS